MKASYVLVSIVFWVFFLNTSLEKKLHKCTYVPETTSKTPFYRHVSVLMQQTRISWRVCAVNVADPAGS